MRHIRLLVLIALAAGLAPLAPWTAAPAVAWAPAQDPDRQMALGISMRDLTLRRLDAFTAEVGPAPAITMVWRHWWWKGKRGQFPALQLLDGIIERGSIPMITWEPFDPDHRTDPRFDPPRITAGEWDAYIRSFARAAASWGKPVLIRFMHEMNQGWHPYSALWGDNTPEDLIALWRHVRDLFREEGATNAFFVWCPSRRLNADATLASLYPGDEWVDYLGLDGYEPRGKSLSMADVFAPAYDAIGALSSKPIIISETGSPNALNKAAWVAAGYEAVYRRFPAVVAIVYFNHRMTTGVDFTLYTPPAAIEEYAGLLTQERFQGRFTP